MIEWGGLYGTFAVVMVVGFTSGLVWGLGAGAAFLYIVSILGSWRSTRKDKLEVGGPDDV